MEQEIAQTTQDNLLCHLEISVSESEKRANSTLNIRDYHTVYLIETKVIDPEVANSKKLIKLSSVWRRYSEFEQLRDYLSVSYPFIIMPPLPEKRILYAWQKTSTDTFDPNFVDRRRAGLENFLLRIAAHPIISWDQHYLEYLQSDGWTETHRSSGYFHVVENAFKKLSVSVRLKKPFGEFDRVKDYSTNLHANLQNLIRARSRVAEKQYTIHKLHANYGKVFSEWSVAEKEMGDALQKTGHYLDSLALSIDGTLEDEEILIDQLKEYLFFSHSLDNVCRNYDVLQQQVEHAEENVSNKNNERARAQQGKISLMSRLFGSVDTEELRELKVAILDRQIEEGSNLVTTSKENLSQFSTQALEEFERFQRQKNLDLKEILTDYSLLQLKAAKKSLQTWTQIQNCLQNIT